MGWGVPRGKQCDVDAHPVVGVLLESFLLPLLDDVDLGEEILAGPGPWGIDALATSYVWKPLRPDW